MRRFDQHRRRGDVEDEPVPTVAGVAPTSGSGGGLRLARHRGTTAHVASIYPFHGGRALHDVRAPYFGVNVTDGHSAWSYDPFELYGRDLGGGTVLTNSNMLVLGEPGNGKSSAVKTMLYRQAAFYGQRRFISISDPKGEYGPLARALGMPIIKPHPGGTDRLNLLEPGRGDPVRSLQNRQELMTGMLSTVMRRDLDAVEETILNTTIEVLDTRHRAGRATPTLVDLAVMLGDLPAEVRGMDELKLLAERDISTAVTSIRLALSKLLRTTLRGMFDGPSTVSIEQMSGQGVVVDLSSVSPTATPWRWFRWRPRRRWPGRWRRCLSRAAGASSSTTKSGRRWRPSVRPRRCRDDSSCAGCGGSGTSSSPTVCRTFKPKPTRAPPHPRSLKVCSLTCKPESCSDKQPTNSPWSANCCG